MKCRECGEEATHYRVIDIDLPKFPLCDNKDCYYKFLIKTNEPYILDDKKK